MSTRKLSDLLKGAVIESVEPAVGAEEGGQFTLVVRRPRDDGKLGKLFSVRVCGTDMGWWAETREGSKGRWRDV